MDTGEAIDTTRASEADSTSADVATERNYEEEARHHGWTPKEEFKGDPSRWVDAETFVKRADEVMPFLKKQNASLKRDLDDAKRQMKKAAEFFSQAEERAYQRALADLERRHDEAVESGDIAASKAIRKEMSDLSQSLPEAPKFEEEKAPDPVQLRKELDAWVAENDWYVLDDKKRAFADLQADLMGPAMEWEGGQQAWLEELGKRVERKFADPKPNPANPGGNRGGTRGGKSFGDLPKEAQAICDKWVRQGIIKDRDTYVKSYQW